ncbi:MAG TPA: tannase/feruloyl esterase family alpha/beta hydrolase [Vicinamibacterales bacterium]|nr:tannase/feruloyl esterase family alpha/beta hydrolase [Vicinamibacterales bacterium]
MITVTALGLMAALAQAAPCESLRTGSFPNTTITSAQLVAAGPYVAPAPGGPPGGPVAPAAGRGDGAGRGGGRGEGAPAAGRGDGAGAGGRGGGRGAAAAPAGPVLPAHCRIAATLKPSADSVIDVEVWMPEASRWNGKFQMVGNGGWAGTISFAAMANAVQEGYATASTDTGHKGGNALFAIDHPEKLTDFAYRAVHETVVTAKAMITKFYDRGPRLSYWNGCSTGGRQGLMSAQKYPEDFDAILAGAPANYQTHLHAWDLAVSTPVLKDTAGAVSAAKLDMVNKAMINACDAKDGVADGILNEPTKCTFDVASLQCKAADAENCLTAPQVAAIKRVYEPVKTSSGQVVFPGKVPGAEAGFGAYIGAQNAPGISVGSFQVAYNDAKWDWRTFDVNKDLPIVDQKVGAIVNAVNPDLSRFKARGGKLLMYHGWNDTAISPGNAIDYYTSVQKRMGGKQDDFIRLFMAPGMNHCGGGPGPNLVNWMAALERWREAGVAPDRIDAVRIANNRIEVSRPLCPYPQIAVYSGKGTTNDAGNFSCKNP